MAYDLLFPLFLTWHFTLRITYLTANGKAVFFFVFASCFFRCKILLAYFSFSVCCFVLSRFVSLYAWTRGWSLTMTKIAPFNASVVVLFSMYSLLEIHTSAHRYILYTLKKEAVILWWRLCKLMWFVELRCVRITHGLVWAECFLKGPYSWRKPDLGEKSYLWLAFFNL